MLTVTSLSRTSTATRLPRDGGGLSDSERGTVPFSLLPLPSRSVFARRLAFGPRRRLPVLAAPSGVPSWRRADGRGSATPWRWMRGSSPSLRAVPSAALWPGRRFVSRPPSANRRSDLDTPGATMGFSTIRLYKCLQSVQRVPEGRETKRRDCPVGRARKGSDGVANPRCVRRVRLYCTSSLNGFRQALPLRRRPCVDAHAPTRHTGSGY